MRQRLTHLIAFLTLTLSVCGQTNKLKTLQYAGTYSYGKNLEIERVGTITVYPESDSTILFYLDVCRGAPSYNLGQLYARLKVVDGFGTYNEKYEWEDKGCKWTIQFLKDNVVIKTIDNQDGCGFGHAVYPDGTFANKSTEKPTFFIDGHNRKYFFKDTKPEDYLK